MNVMMAVSCWSRGPAHWPWTLIHLKKALLLSVFFQVSISFNCTSSQNFIFKVLTPYQGFRQNTFIALWLWKGQITMFIYTRATHCVEFVLLIFLWSVLMATCRHSYNIPRVTLSQFPGIFYELWAFTNFTRSNICKSHTVKNHLSKLKFSLTKIP